MSDSLYSPIQIIGAISGQAGITGNITIPTYVYDVETLNHIIERIEALENRSPKWVYSESHDLDIE